MQRLNALVEHIDRYKDVLVKRRIKEQNIEVKNSPSSISLWQRLITHPRKRVTLSFLLLPDRVFVVRAWKFFFDFAVIPTTRLEVRNTVQRWHERIKGINGSRDLSALPDEDSYESVMAVVANENQNIANYLAKILAIQKLHFFISLVMEPLNKIVLTSLAWYSFLILDRKKFSAYGNCLT